MDSKRSIIKGLHCTSYGFSVNKDYKVSHLRNNNTGYSLSQLEQSSDLDLKLKVVVHVVYKHMPVITICFWEIKLQLFYPSVKT